MESEDHFTIEKKDLDIYLTPKNIKHTETLIFLHGVGDTAEGWLGHFRDLKISPLKKTTKIILLTAPKRSIEAFGNMRMNAWYNVKTRDFSGNKKFEDMFSVEDIEETTKRINRIIEKESKELDENSKGIFIGGFSQGCATALHVGISSEKRIGGIIAYSGWLFPITDFNSANFYTLIFISHGKDDDKITFKRAQGSYERLKIHSASSSRQITEIFPEQMGHSVNFSVISATREWFDANTQ